MEVVRFGTYSIRNGHNVGLELELRGMDQVNSDMGLLQETKIKDRVYTQEFVGFFVVTLDSLNLHPGGVALFYKELT